MHLNLMMTVHMLRPNVAQAAHKAEAVEGRPECPSETR